jgi:hypothetical protein
MPAKPNAAALEKVLLQGDLSSLEPEERITYYRELCASLDLNPLTKPFEYLEMKGQGGKMMLILYVRKDCTDQLRNKHGASSKIISREVIDGVYVVTAQASTLDGRVEESIGAVPIMKEGGKWSTRDGRREFEGDGTFVPLRPEERANAMMKAETKAKRRATLSLFGLGLTDESEVETIGSARTVSVEDAHSGKLLESGAVNAGSGAAGDPPSSAAPRKIPKELELVVESMRRNDFSSVNTACDFLQKECAALGIEKKFLDRQQGIRASFPKGTKIPSAVMEGFLLDVWDEIESQRKLDSPKEGTEDPKEGWLPDGFGDRPKGKHDVDIGR